MAASLTKTQSYTKPWEVQTTGTALTVTLVTDDYLWIRQTLGTTDPAVTPTLSLMEIELTAAALDEKIFIGSTGVTKAYLGSTEITKIMLGSEQVLP